LRWIRANDGQQDFSLQVVPQPEQILTRRMVFETFLCNLDEPAEECPFLVSSPTAPMHPRDALAAEDVICVAAVLS
jgi:hypothetical protein